MKVKWDKPVHCGRWSYVPGGHNRSDLDSTEACLVINDGTDAQYDIEIARINERQFVNHMASKDWVTDEDVGCLVRIILILQGCPGDQIRTEPTALEAIETM